MRGTLTRGKATHVGWGRRAGQKDGDGVVPTGTPHAGHPVPWGQQPAALGSCWLGYMVCCSQLCSGRFEVASPAWGWLGCPQHVPRCGAGAAVCLALPLEGQILTLLCFLFVFAGLGPGGIGAGLGAGKAGYPTGTGTAPSPAVLWGGRDPQSMAGGASTPLASAVTGWDTQRCLVAPGWPERG